MNELSKQVRNLVEVKDPDDSIGMLSRARLWDSPENVFSLRHTCLQLRGYISDELTKEDYQFSSMYRDDPL